MAYPPPGGGYGAPPPGYGHDLGGYGAAPPPHGGYDARSSPYGGAAGGYGAPPPRHEGPSTDHYTAPPQPGYPQHAPPPGGGGAPPPGPDAYGYDPYHRGAPAGYPPPSSYPSSGYPPPEGGYPPPSGSYGGPPPGDPYYGGPPGGYGAPPPGYGPPPPGYGPPPAGGYGAPPPPGYGPPPPGYGGGAPGYDRPPPGGQGRSPPRREGGREAKRRRGDKGDGRGEKGGGREGGGRQERGGRGGKGERGDRKGGGDGGGQHEDSRDSANSSEPRGQVHRLLAKHPSWLSCWFEGVDPPKRTGSSPNVSFLIVANPALKKEGGGEEFGFMISQVRLAAKKRERERECTKELAPMLGALPIDDPKAWCTLPSAASTKKEVDPFDVEKVRGMVSGRVPRTTVELQDTTACLMTGSSPFILDRDRPKGVGLVQEPDVGILDRLDPGFGELWAEARRVSGIVRKQWFVSVLTVKAQGSDRALALGVGIATEKAAAQVRALHAAESRAQILTPEMLAKAV